MLPSIPHQVEWTSVGRNTDDILHTPTAIHIMRIETSVPCRCAYGRIRVQAMGRGCRRKMWINLGRRYLQSIHINFRYKWNDISYALHLNWVFYVLQQRRRSAAKWGRRTYIERSHMPKWLPFVHTRWFKTKLFTRTLHVMAEWTRNWRKSKVNFVDGIESRITSNSCRHTSNTHRHTQHAFMAALN